MAYFHWVGAAGDASATGAVTRKDSRGLANNKRRPTRRTPGGKAPAPGRERGARCVSGRHGVAVLRGRRPPPAGESSSPVPVLSRPLGAGDAPGGQPAGIAPVARPPLAVTAVPGLPPAPPAPSAGAGKAVDKPDRRLEDGGGKRPPAGDKLAVRRGAANLLVMKGDRELSAGRRGSFAGAEKLGKSYTRVQIAGPMESMAYTNSLLQWGRGESDCRTAWKNFWQRGGQVIESRGLAGGSC